MPLTLLGIGVKHIGGHINRLKSVLDTLIEETAEVSLPLLDGLVHIIKTKTNYNQVGVVREHVAIEIFQRVVGTSTSNCGIDHIDGSVLPSLVYHEPETVVINTVVINLAVERAVRHTVTADDHVDRAALGIFYQIALYKLLYFEFHSDYFTRW